MKLILLRGLTKDLTTIGQLTDEDGVHICYTLEDAICSVKKYGESCIPPGDYDIKITYSPRFKRDLPLLIDVPNYEGVRIHPGNTKEDTLGCILVGTAVEGDTVVHSRDAFDKVFILLQMQDDNSISIANPT
jgi:hypothetical protein